MQILPYVGCGFKRCRHHPSFTFRVWILLMYITSSCEAGSSVFVSKSKKCLKLKFWHWEMFTDTDVLSTCRQDIQICYHMRSTVDKSISIENTLSGSLPTVVVFFHIAHPLSHSAFSLPLSTITIDTMDATHAQMINQLFTTYGEISLVAKAVLHSYLWHLCNTCLDNPWYFTVCNNTTWELVHS